MKYRITTTEWLKETNEYIVEAESVEEAKRIFDTDSNIEPEMEFVKQIDYEVEIFKVE